MYLQKHSFNSLFKVLSTKKEGNERTSMGHQIERPKSASIIHIPPFHGSRTATYVDVIRQVHAHIKDLAKYCPRFGDFHTEVAFSTESSFHFKCYLAAQKYQSAATGQTAELCNLALILITYPVELGPKMCCHVIFSSGLSILRDIDGDKVARLDPRRVMFME